MHLVAIAGSDAASAPHCVPANLTLAEVTVWWRRLPELLYLRHPSTSPGGHPLARRPATWTDTFLTWIWRWSSGLGSGAIS